MDPPLTTGASDALGNLIKTKFTLIIHLIIIDDLCTHTYGIPFIWTIFLQYIIIRNSYICNAK